jgi:hypothetical protein
VLTFTGAGFIDVTPLTGQGGTLYVEMEEDGVTKLATYKINLVDKHTCQSEKWITVIEPTSDTDGYMVKKCDICGDIIDFKVVSNCSKHSYGSYITETEPTETEYGLKYRECSVCGHKDYIVIKTTADTELDTLTLSDDSSFIIDRNNNYLTNVAEKTKVSDLISEFKNDNLVVRNIDGEEIDKSSNTFVGTGCVVQVVKDDKVTDEVVLLVKGDVTGDGKKNISDIVKLFNHIQGTQGQTLTGVYKEAANMNSDSKVNVADLVKLFNEVQN